jgi:hypothetical protein
VGAVLVESHRFGGVKVDLGTTTLDFSVPRWRRARIRLAVETAN